MKRFIVAVSMILAGAAATAAEPAGAAIDVAYWTTSYAGADLTAGKFDCRVPDIPAYSKTNDEVKATSKAIDAWQACYNGFVDNMNDAMPAGKRIPAEVRAKMSPAELEQAQAHLDQVYGKVIEQAQATAEATLAKREAWRAETNKYIAEQNKALAMRWEAEKKQLETEARKSQEIRSANLGLGLPTPSPRPSSGK